MEERALGSLLDVAARQNLVSPAALEAYRAKSLAHSEAATVRDGVAIINAIGPMFKRANLFTAVSGATSYDVMMRDFRTALDSPKVKAILFNVDSPGGEAGGVNELAEAVFGGRGRKPIGAYVGGYAASAGYWITSAADPGRVVVDPTAILGSIGIQIAFTVPGDKAGEKRFRFVSSQSPLKNADPGTEQGARGIQSTIDAMARVFVDAVARNRGVTVDTVLSKFGRGGTFVGQGAVKAGLADRIGSFESVLAELAKAR